MSEVIFRGGTILTIDPQHRVLAGDLATYDGAIVQVGGNYAPAISLRSAERHELWGHQPHTVIHNRINFRWKARSPP